MHVNASVIFDLASGPLESLLHFKHLTVSHIQIFNFVFQKTSWNNRCFNGLPNRLSDFIKQPSLKLAAQQGRLPTVTVCRKDINVNNDLSASLHQNTGLLCLNSLSSSR